VTVVTFAWIPDPGGGLILLQVIWAIGWSMILLAPVVCLPAVSVGLLGLVLMGLGSLHEAGLLLGRDWFAVLLIEGGQQTLEPGGGWTLIVSYPILPWTGVMAAGYGLGPLMAGPAARWRSAMLVLGAGLLALFVMLRLGNLGGDPVPWLRYPDPMITVLSFLNAEKYPPSPLYLLMTLGVVLILLSAFARLDQLRIARVLRTLGRAPLFFYILHLYVLRIAGLIAAALVWGPDRLGPPPLHSTPEWPLPGVWAVWLVAMVILYWPTRRFARLKARRHGGWTSYL
jgi:uncharacterized membrane protein